MTWAWIVRIHPRSTQGTIHSVALGGPRIGFVE